LCRGGPADAGYERGQTTRLAPRSSRIAVEAGELRDDRGQAPAEPALVLEIVVAGGRGLEVGETELLDAVWFGHDWCSHRREPAHRIP
jgi:hypothetical protein